MTDPAKKYVSIEEYERRMNADTQGEPKVVDIENPNNQPWPPLDKTILDADRDEPAPFPTQVLGPYEAFVLDQSKAKSAPVDYICGSLIAISATLIGSTRAGQPAPEWKEPTGLWIAMVGEPGTGKSPGIDSVANLLDVIESEMQPGFEAELRQYETDKELAQIHKASWQEDVKAAAETGNLAPPMPVEAIEPESPHTPRHRVYDATIESIAPMLAKDARLMSFHDELSGLFASMSKYTSGSDQPWWVEAYGERVYRPRAATS